MRLLALQAYSRLIYFDLLLASGNFLSVYQKVRNCPLTQLSGATGGTARICAAVDRACIWYWKEVSCLQRSAATTCLLKQHGLTARMMIGAQPLPFKAHAWVEVDGIVVNDKPYMREIYAVLDQC